MCGGDGDDEIARDNDTTDTLVGETGNDCGWWDVGEDVINL
jgi:hypothetical protein